LSGWPSGRCHSSRQQPTFGPDQQPDHLTAHRPNHAPAARSSTSATSSTGVAAVSRVTAERKARVRVPGDRGERRRSEPAGRFVSGVGLPREVVVVQETIAAWRPASRSAPCHARLAAARRRYFRIASRRNGSFSYG
jgi:hypothetical protein